jgi:hypothetical protein
LAVNYGAASDRIPVLEIRKVVIEIEETAMNDAKNIPSVQVSEKLLPVQHVTVVIDRPYADVKRALESRVNKLNDSMRTLLKEQRAEALKTALQDAAGEYGLLIHYTALHGDWLILNGGAKPTTAYLIGNVLSAVQMTAVSYGSGLYAPLRVVLYENDQGGSTFEYDKPTTLFGQFGVPSIDAMAKSLDERLARLLASLAVG